MPTAKEKFLEAAADLWKEIGEETPDYFGDGITDLVYDVVLTEEVKEAIPHLFKRVEMLQTLHNLFRERDISSHLN